MLGLDLKHNRPAVQVVARLVQLSPNLGGVGTPRQAIHEPVLRRAFFDRWVGQQVADHLGEVGFAGTEEAGDPDADLVGPFAWLARSRLDVTLQEAQQLPLDGLSGDVLLELFGHLGFGDVIHLDDGGDVAVNRVKEEVFDLHSCTPS